MTLGGDPKISELARGAESKSEHADSAGDDTACTQCYRGRSVATIRPQTNLKPDKQVDINSNNNDVALFSLKNVVDIERPPDSKTIRYYILCDQVPGR